MYAGLDVIDVAEKTAEATIVKDRELYRKYLAAIEKFAEKERVIIGGEHATRLLLAGSNDAKDHKISPLEWSSIELYGPNALTSAKKLATMLYELDPEGMGHFAVMLTKVPGNEFGVGVNTRELTKWFHFGQEQCRCSDGPCSTNPDAHSVCRQKFN